jgi:hypothetical protein
MRGSVNAGERARTERTLRRSPFGSFRIPCSVNTVKAPEDPATGEEQEVDYRVESDHGLVPESVSGHGDR